MTRAQAPNERSISATDAQHSAGCQGKTLPVVMFQTEMMAFSRMPSNIQEEEWQLMGGVIILTDKNKSLQSSVLRRRHHSGSQTENKIQATEGQHCTRHTFTLPAAPVTEMRQHEGSQCWGSGGGTPAISSSADVRSSGWRESGKEEVSSEKDEDVEVMQQDSHVDLGFQAVYTNCRDEPSYQKPPGS
ncbi:hypothetical protein KOW79_007666 [Hemibagrus wyckioides]|uniref:Uncharacterized protein n=1 Tax=Hemibagrus wyckioides TaxID=337641 RepID=A0A9D3NZ00_9TELE|nr:hypothetical protein KOW79_007666 [Hemibagrus wyckioides]